MSEIKADEAQMTMVLTITDTLTGKQREVTLTSIPGTIVVYP